MTPQERFWSKVSRHDDGCWTWTAGTYQGYGRFRLGGAGSRNALAHRVAWEWEHGPLADGIELDHLCHNRACVRLDHLEPVDPATNKQRQRPRKLRDACRAGHPYVPGSYRIRAGMRARICRPCERERARLNPAKMDEPGAPGDNRCHDRAGTRPAG